MTHRLLDAYERHGGNPAKLPKPLKKAIAGIEFYLARNGESARNSYKPWQRIISATTGAALSSGAAALAYDALRPAVVEAEETSNQNTDENLRLYNYAFGAGKVIIPKLGVSFVPELGSFKIRLVDSPEMIEEHTAVVRLAKDGLEYTVNRPIPHNFYGSGYEVDRGFIPYDRIEQIKREIDEKQRKKPKWKKALGTFFIKTTPDSDDFKRDIIGQMQQFAFDDFVKMGYAETVPRDLKLPYSVMEHFLPNIESPQIPQGPKKLEDMLTEGYVDLKMLTEGYVGLKQGTFYYKNAGNGLVNYRWLSGDFIEREGVINLRAVTTREHLAISSGIIDSVRHKMQVEKEQYQERIKKFSEEYKGFILSISPYVNRDELEKINFGLIAQGFVPVFVESDRVLGVQFSGRYAKVSNGDNVLEGALGVVVNQAISKDSMTQFSVFYQHRYDVRSDAHFGAVAGTLAVQVGDVTLDFYVNQPVTGRQKIKSERTTADTTSTTTSGGNTVTRTTRLETLITEYEEVRRVLSLNLEYDFRNNPAELLRTLKLRGGVVWYSGRDNETAESGNVKRSVEGYSDELKAALGFTYVFDELSRRWDQRIEAYGDIRVGQGKPQFEAGLRTFFGESYRDYLRRAGKGGIDLYRLARLIDLQKGRFKVTKETKNQSPSLSGDCPTTGTVGVEYTCNFTASGTDFSVIQGISSLTLTKTGDHTARYSGTPTSSDIGSHPIKIKATTNGLDSFKDYTLTISGSLPTLSSIGNKTGNEGSPLEFIISCTNCDSTSASNLPTGATYTASTKTFSWTPTFAQSGTYTPTFSATNASGTTNETITITVNNVVPTITISPSSNQTINAGGTIDWQSTPSHSGTITWSTTTVAGTCATITNTEDPGSTTYNNAATCDVNVSLTVSGGVTVDSSTIRITVNAAPPPPPG